MASQFMDALTGKNILSQVHTVMYNAICNACFWLDIAERFCGLNFCHQTTIQNILHLVFSSVWMI